MKKVKMMFLSLGMVALLSTGACKKDDDEPALTCDEATTAATAAATAFATTRNEANCVTLKTALTNKLNACKSGYTQAEIDAAQAEIDRYDCSALACVDAGTAVVAAQTAFAATPTKATCNALKTALTNALNACRSGLTPAQITSAQSAIDALNCDAL